MSKERVWSVGTDGTAIPPGAQGTNATKPSWRETAVSAAIKGTQALNVARSWNPFASESGDDSEASDEPANDKASVIDDPLGLRESHFTFTGFGFASWEGGLAYEQVVRMSAQYHRHGIGAELLNDQYDKWNLKDTSMPGGANAKNGADRVVDGESIQTKFHSTAASGMRSAFDTETGQYRYVNEDGSPMALEVPHDQYADYLTRMREAIVAGRVPGVDPADVDKAEEIVKQSPYTYEQAVNVAKFCTVESLKFDAKNGAVAGAIGGGVTFILTYALGVWNGQSQDDALRDALKAGLKAGGLSFLASVLASQLGRSEWMRKLTESTVGTAFKAISSSKVLHSIGVTVSDKPAHYLKSLSRRAQGTAAVAAISWTINSIPDSVSLARGRMSSVQFMKNGAVNAGTIAGSLGGSWGGVNLARMALGTTPQGAVAGGAMLIGSIAGAKLASMATQKLVDSFADDDALEMQEIFIAKFDEMARSYLLTEEEASVMLDEIVKADLRKVFMSMYAERPDKREDYVATLLSPILQNVLASRSPVMLPRGQDGSSDESASSI